MPAPILPPPEYSHPEDVRAAAVKQAQDAISEGQSQNRATAAVAESLGVTRSTIQRWAIEQGVDLGARIAGQRVRNAVTQHLVISMQRKREMAQRLLRVIDVQVQGLERQARRGSAKIDSVLLGRTVGDLATLSRLDDALMLQVGRVPGGDAATDSDDVAERAAGVVDEYAGQWERERALFRPPA